MRFWRHRPGVTRTFSNKFPLRKFVMTKIIELAQTWSHSKIGWVANKAGMAVAAVLGKIGIENGDTTQQVIAAVVGLVTVLLELGVKTASDKLVGGLQTKFPTLKRDYWPGPDTRSTVDSALD